MLVSLLVSCGIRYEVSFLNDLLEVFTFGHLFLVAICMLIRVAW